MPHLSCIPPWQMAGLMLTNQCSQTYSVAAGALQLQVAVELRGQCALALHLPAEMKGAAPGPILPAVNHVASTALGMREEDNDGGHKKRKQQQGQAGK